MRDMLIKLWWHQTFCADVFFRRIFATRSIFKADYSTHLVQLKTFNNDKLYSIKICITNLQTFIIFNNELLGKYANTYIHKRIF